MTTENSSTGEKKTPRDMEEEVQLAISLSVADRDATLGDLPNDFSKRQARLLKRFKAIMAIDTAKIVADKHIPNKRRIARAVALLRSANWAFHLTEWISLLMMGCSILWLIWTWVERSGNEAKLAGFSLAIFVFGFFLWWQCKKMVSIGQILYNSNSCYEEEEFKETMVFLEEPAWANLREVALLYNREVDTLDVSKMSEEEILRPLVTLAREILKMEAERDFRSTTLLYINTYRRLLKERHALFVRERVPPCDVTIRMVYELAEAKMKKDLEDILKEHDYPEER